MTGLLDEVIDIKRLPRDVAELFLIPGLGSALPWPLCFQLLKGLSTSRWLFPEETERALRNACKFSRVANPRAWSDDYRLVRLVDYTDLYLSRFRRDRWLERYLDVEGPGWPRSRGFLAITFHWGAGLWGLRHLRSQRHNATVLVRRLDQQEFSGMPLVYGYARLRTAETAHAGGAPVIFAGTGSIPAMRRTIASGFPVVGLFDVSIGEQRNSLDAAFLGGTASFPRGLVFLAVSGSIPVVTYRVALDRETGRRRLILSPPLVAQSEQELLAVLVRHLEEAIREYSAAWHNWPGVEAFFKAEPAASSEAAPHLDQ
jgi:phosphatidylinositol dimannoside acyltransferase